MIVLKFDDIKGVVYITSPKVGTLLQLQGIVGKGVFIVKSTREEKGVETCLSAPIRVAAGGFGGASIGIRSSEAIQLVIYSSAVANRLLLDSEIFSEEYDVTVPSDARLGDIKIVSGLNLSHGFVLNPVEWSWSSLLGTSKESVACDVMFDRILTVNS